MAKERAKFEAGALEHHDIEPRVSGPVFDLLEKFAGYGFNKSHAAAYSLVAYQTAWLKEHHPAQFMAAVLSSDMDSTDKVVTFLDEARARAEARSVGNAGCRDGRSWGGPSPYKNKK